MLLRALCIVLFFAPVIGFHCDGLDEIAQNLAGAGNEDENGEAAGDRLAFVNTIKMIDNDRSFWDTDGFSGFSDPVGDAVNSYGDIGDVRFAHNANNLYAEVSREDGAWDFASDYVMLDVETGGDVYSLTIDFDGTYTISNGDDVTCNNDSQEIIEGVHDGGVILAKLPLNQSENLVNCFEDEVEVIDRMRVVIGNDSGQCGDGQCDELVVDTRFKLEIPDGPAFDIQTISDFSQLETTMDTLDDSSATFVDSTTNTVIADVTDIERVFLGHDNDFDSLFIGIELRGTGALSGFEYLVEFHSGGNAYGIIVGDGLTAESTINGAPVCVEGSDLITNGPITNDAGQTFEIEIVKDACMIGLAADDVVTSFVVAALDISKLEVDTFDARRLSMNAD